MAFKQVAWCKLIRKTAYMAQVITVKVLLVCQTKIKYINKNDCSQIQSIEFLSIKEMVCRLQMNYFRKNINYYVNHVRNGFRQRHRGCY